MKINNLRIGIKNLIYYFKVIWNDRDWNYYFLYELLQKKLEKMNDYFYNSPLIMGEKKDRIFNSLCTLTAEIERLKTGEDELDHINEFEEIFGIDYTSMLIIEENENGVLEFKSNLTDEQRVFLDQLRDKYLAKHDNDRLAIFQLLSYSIEDWWD